MSAMFPNYNNNNKSGVSSTTSVRFDPSSMQRATTENRHPAMTAAYGNAPSTAHAANNMNANLGPSMQMARLAEATANSQNAAAMNNAAMASRLNLYQQLQALQQVPQTPQMPMNAARLAASNLTPQQPEAPFMNAAAMMQQQQQQPDADQLAQSILAALTQILCQSIPPRREPETSTTVSQDSSEKNDGNVSISASSNSSFSGGGEAKEAKKSGGFIVPCRARGMPMEHNFQNAYFTLKKDIKHGDALVCSFPACRNRGIKFLYCAFCKDPISRRNFRKHHSHLNESKEEDAAGARKRKPSDDDDEEDVPTSKKAKSA